MVMPYHLHMPSYFLETFTEYPDLDRFYSEKFPNYIEGRKFVPRMWLGGQKY